MSSMINKFYAVRIGRVPGIYSTWEECKKQVHGFSSAQYKSFTNRDECDKYLEGLTSSIADLKISTGMVSPQPSLLIKRARLFVDGGHNKMTGDEAWGSVVDDCGKDVLPLVTPNLLTDFKCKDVKLPTGPRRVIVAKFGCGTFGVKLKQQNNGAELLAMVAGLRIAVSVFSNVSEVYSDSDLIVKWWSKSLSSKKREELTRNDPIKLKYIEELQRLRATFESKGGIITKISGDDNLADLGYHKKS